MEHCGEGNGFLFFCSKKPLDGCVFSFVSIPLEVGIGRPERGAVEECHFRRSLQLRKFHLSPRSDHPCGDRSAAGKGIAQPNGGAET